MTNASVPVHQSTYDDRHINIGRAIAALRKKMEIDGQPETLRLRRFFLSKREHRKAKASAKMRVGGKIQKYPRKF